MKITATKLLTSFLVAVVILAMGIVWAWYSRDRSVYSEGFSEGAFQKVRVGMSEAAVLSLLGQPLSRRVDPTPEYWHYGKEFKITGLTISYGEEANYVCFGEDGTVIKVHGGLARLVRFGMTHEEVLRFAGRPRLRIPASSEVWHYSKPADFGLYRARIITFGEERMVVEVVTYDTHD